MNFDDWGRLEETQIPHLEGSPRGSILNTREWELNGNEFIKTTTTSATGVLEEDHLDLLGRSVRSVRVATGLGQVTATKGYDAKGNLVIETTPHKTNEQYLTVQHSFDPYNRPYQDANSLSGTTEYGYAYSNGQLTVTTSNLTSGQFRSRTTDAAGRTVRANDDGGDLKYTYDSWGNVLNVYHCGILVARNRYDGYGRQTEMYVPNAGTTRYKYDPFGRLTWQKDADGNEISNGYDNMGHIMRKNAPEGYTTYTYLNQNGRSQMTSLSLMARR